MKNMVMKQLDQQLSELKPLKSVQSPMRGWLRAIRDALGMSGPQMARRMSVTKQRISLMEKAEVNGSATLNSMRQAAEALECQFIYAVVPRDSLKATVERQARKLAEKEQAYTSQTMLLEDQMPSPEERAVALESAVADIIQRMPKSLWD
ncbi:mobile mystery protein A [Pseudomonadota bacterium]